MIGIENTLCVRSVMDVTPVFQIEVEPWGAASIVRTVNDRVYIYSCSVRSDEYMCDKKHVFVHDSNFKKIASIKILWGSN